MTELETPSQQIDRIFVWGCLGWLVIVTVTCALSGVVETLRPHHNEVQLCADACGTGRMQSFDRYHGCICTEAP